MRGGKKRRDGDVLSDVQALNQDWWTHHTMSYDWRAPIAADKYSLEWFDDVDRRFIHGARLFAHSEKPFDLILPLDALNGKRVLEIGCGMGLHSELLIRAGAKLASIDLSETSVAATNQRFRLKNLKGDIRQMDAEKLDFPDEEFDFIWSWGVIHHSSHTGRVVRNIHRVLKPGGECRVMVYHLGGMPAYLSMMLEYSIGFWRDRSLDEYLWAASDGFTARHYSRDMLRDLFSAFFDEVSINVYGQDADAMPLPRRLRPWALRLVSKEWQRRQVQKRGAFVFATARKD